jgi:biotin carboxyl carrier protein
MKLLVTLNGRERTVEWCDGDLTFLLDGEEVQADVVQLSPGSYSILWDGQSYEILVQDAAAGGEMDLYLRGRRFTAQVRDPRRLKRNRGALDLEGRQNIVAPMPGKIVRLIVVERQEVEAGQGLLVIEAMKMQNEIKSPKSGRVVEARVSEGQAVTAGQTLMVVE